MILVDASAMVDLLLGTPKGLRVDAQLRDDVPIAPELIDVEVSSALARLERAGTVTRVEADNAMSRFVDMPIHRLNHRAVALDAWPLRHSLRLTDAFYIACALAIDAAILTLDQRMMRGAPPEVRFIPI